MSNEPIDVATGIVRPWRSRWAGHTHIDALKSLERDIATQIEIERAEAKLEEAMFWEEFFKGRLDWMDQRDERIAQLKKMAGQPAAQAKKAEERQ